MSDQKKVPIQKILKNMKNIITPQKMDYYNKKYHMSDTFLGNSLLTLANKISSPRENMFNAHEAQFLVMLNPEVPRVFTGYEKEVGKYSRSYMKASKNYIVKDKIVKYANYPNLQYILVIQDLNGVYDVIIRKPAQQLTEQYGYMYVNDLLDSKNPGSTIQEGELLFHSTSFDSKMNYRYGKNVNVVFLSQPSVTEDSIVISEELAKSMQYPYIDTAEVPVNTNEFLLNTYGNDDMYITFPHIGQDIANNILAVKRRKQNASILYDLKNENLQRINFNEDTVSYTSGTVVDIDVYSNKKIEDIPDIPANQQIRYYLQVFKNYNKTIKEKLGKLIKKFPDKCSDALVHLYHRAEDLYSDKQIVNNSSKFENVYMVFTIIKIKSLKKGNKLTGRFGEKGVIGKIVPRAEMPMNEYGEHTDMMVSPQSVFSRLNTGQWYEHELTFLADNFLRDIQNKLPNNVEGQLLAIAGFLEDINPQQGLAFKQYIGCLSQNDKMFVLNETYTKGIHIHQPPFWENCSLKKLQQLYKKYPYPLYSFTVKGRKINKPMIMGKKYVMLLKQTPESKFSVRSLGMISPLGHPSKSIKFKKKNTPVSNSPIRLGEMEIMNLNMSNNPNMIAELLSLYANSKENRSLAVRHLISDDPFNIDFKSEQITSINRKILNAYLKSIGYQLIDD